MWSRRIAVVLLLAAVGITAWLIVGSFVTYGPSVSATEMQNIYLRRIVNLGALLLGLQLAAIIVLLSQRRPSASRGDGG